jgi:hypothetical protein
VNLLTPVLRCLIVVSCVSLTVLAVPAQALVLVDEREWLQPADLVGYAWQDFGRACPGGRCVAALAGDGPDIRGWTWASAGEVGDLFARLTPHPGGAARYFSTDPSAAADFLSSSGFMRTTGLATAIEFGVTAVVGFTASQEPIGGAGYIGFVQLWLFPGFSRGSTIDTTATFAVDEPSEVVGAWLYRTRGVPAPSTLFLLALGVLALLRPGSRR